MKGQGDTRGLVMSRLSTPGFVAYGGLANCPYVLTEQGRACTRAAEAAIADTLAAWEALLGTEGLLALRDDLLQVAPAGPLRPTW